MLTSDRGLVDLRADDLDVRGRRPAHRDRPRRPTGTTVVHSDGDGQGFRSHLYQRTLRIHGLRGLMGRVAAAGDNAAMESSFSLLRKNVLNRQRWDTRDELRIAIATWVESTYNQRRRQRSLGRLIRSSSNSSTDANHLAEAA